MAVGNVAKDNKLYTAWGKNEPDKRRSKTINKHMFGNVQLAAGKQVTIGCQ